MCYTKPMLATLIDKSITVDFTRWKRNTFLYLDKYEIALDYVKNLGCYIEIEVKNYSKNPVDEYSDLLILAKKLNLNLDNIDKRGYPYHIMFNTNW